MPCQVGFLSGQGLLTGAMGREFSAPGVGNKPRDSLKGSHKGWFMESFPYSLLSTSNRNARRLWMEANLFFSCFFQISSCTQLAKPSIWLRICVIPHVWFERESIPTGHMSQLFQAAKMQMKGGVLYLGTHFLSWWTLNFLERPF